MKMKNFKYSITLHRNCIRKEGVFFEKIPTN